MLCNTEDKTCRMTIPWAALFFELSWLVAIVSADSVVIHAERETLDNAPGVVRRQGLSLESCAEACAKETQIACKFFKYLNETGTCLLSATDNPQVNRLAASSAGTVPSLNIGGKGRKSMTAWVSELEEKVDELQDQESDIENLKSAITDIRDELKMLRKSRISEAHRNRASKEAQQQAYTQLTRKIVGLKVDGEKFKAAVHALSNMQRVLAKEIVGTKDEQKDILLKVSELEKTAGDITTLIASLKATDSGLHRELDSVKDGTNDLANKFSKLKDRINQEIANKQMPPGMVKLKHNQGALATALESMTDKVSSLMSRLPFLEKELRGTNQKVSNQAMYERELQSKLKVLYKNLIEIKKSVHNLLDPRSAVNMERAKGVLKLKSDVSMLAELDKGLKNELQEQREDMARLVKDVARVQLMAQNLKDKLTLVLTASRQFQQDIAVLKSAQKKGLSVVEVAQMQKQVLIALNRLKTREAILMKQLNKYRASVKKVARQVSKTSRTKSHTRRAVTQLQHRLNRFQKQMQFLFDRTESVSRRLRRPPRVKGISRLFKDQSVTNAKLVNLVRQLQTMRKRISLLSVELKETKEEAEKEKDEMAKEVYERKMEMKERQRELRIEALKEQEENNRLLKEKEMLMARKRKKEKQKMKKEMQKEKRKRRLEKQKNRALKNKARKLRKQKKRDKLKRKKRKRKRKRGRGKMARKGKRKRKRKRGRGKMARKGKRKRKRKKGRGKMAKRGRKKKRRKGKGKMRKNRKRKKRKRKKKRGRKKKKRGRKKKKRRRKKKKRRRKKKRKGRGKKKRKGRGKKRGRGKKKGRGRKKKKGKGSKNSQKDTMTVKKTVKKGGKPVVSEEDTIVISKNPKQAKEALAAVMKDKKGGKASKKSKRKRSKKRGKKRKGKKKKRKWKRRKKRKRKRKRKKKKRGRRKRKRKRGKKKRKRKKEKEAKRPKEAITATAEKSVKKTFTKIPKRRRKKRDPGKKQVTESPKGNRHELRKEIEGQK